MLQMLIYPNDNKLGQGMEIILESGFTFSVLSYYVHTSESKSENIRLYYEISKVATIT